MRKLVAAALAVFAALATSCASAQEGWRGLYFGVSGASFKGKSTWTTTQMGGDIFPFCPPGCPTSQEGDLGAKGGLYSAQLGYNHTFGALLVGLEGSVGNSGMKGSIGRTPGWFDDGTSPDRITATYEWNGSVVARVGLTAGPLLFYGLVGPTWQKFSIRFECPATGSSWCISGPQSENHADVLAGWVGGAGVEWRFLGRWMARIDYRHSRYEDKDHTFFANSFLGIDAVSARTTLSTDAIGVGLSVRY